MTPTEKEFIIIDCTLIGDVQKDRAAHEASYPYLNRAKARVDVDFILTNLLQGSHGLSDIIKVLDRSREPPGHVVNLFHDLLHEAQVLGVHVAAVQHLPSIGFCCHGNLEILCGGKETQW